MLQGRQQQRGHAASLCCWTGCALWGRLPGCCSCHAWCRWDVWGGGVGVNRLLTRVWGGMHVCVCVCDGGLGCGAALFSSTPECRLNPLAPLIFRLLLLLLWGFADW